jgi:hypothetical protein
MDRVVQAYVSPFQGSQFFFMPTQGGARLRRAYPGLVYRAPSGLTLRNKTSARSTRFFRFAQFCIQDACHMPFEYEADDFLRWFQGGFSG